MGGEETDIASAGRQQPRAKDVALFESAMDAKIRQSAIDLHRGELVNYSLRITAEISVR